MSRKISQLKRPENAPNVPAIPLPTRLEILDTLAKLLARTLEVKPSLKALTNEYTIDGQTETGYTFMFGKSFFAMSMEEDEAMQAPASELEAVLKEASSTFKEDSKKLMSEFEDEAYLKKDADAVPQASAMAFGFGNDTDVTTLSLEEPKQWAMSWTTYQDVYRDALPSLDHWASSLTDADEASKQFWPTIAQHGLAYNLLILEKVRESNFDKFMPSFESILDDSHQQLAERGLLYGIDMTLFKDMAPATAVHRFTPSAMILLEQDPTSKALTPIAVRIAGYKDEDAMVYTRQNATDGAWLYALQAAKVAITVYGIWLGHVYHWHMVTAAMQMTMYNSFDESHDIYKLLHPLSDYLIAFDKVLLWKWETVAPPTAISTKESFIQLLNLFATGRSYLDDDPISTLERNGIKMADFSVDESWDQYPIVKSYLSIWKDVVDYVDVFVETTYKTDGDVANDNALQAWINSSASSNPEQGGNIKGLPKMDNKKALKEVLQSFIYRITMHGMSRLNRSANPVLTFVANYPPCLHSTYIPEPSEEVDTKTLFTYMPQTGVIGKMINFYFTFVYSKPYVSLIPTNDEEDLFFPDGLSDPRNRALIKLRKAVLRFMLGYEERLQVGQWPRNIET